MNISGWEIAGFIVVIGWLIFLTGNLARVQEELVDIQLYRWKIRAILAALFDRLKIKWIEDSGHIEEKP